MDAKIVYRFRLDDLIAFIFPKEFQHPLSTGRLYAFGECGPLDELGRLHSGFKGAHIVMAYELEEMCMQYEREDMVQIYLHKPGDMGLLSTMEQEMIIAQADGHLKRAKGRAMLPPLTRDDVTNIFSDLSRDEDDMINFHAAQIEISKFRRNRIKEFKKVFPSIGTKKQVKTKTGEETDGFPLISSSQAKSLQAQKKSKSGRVSDSIAPHTMFQRMKGNTNSDVIEETTRHLNAHGFKIIDIDSTSSLTAANVRILREVGPRCKNPYDSSEESKREEWNSTCALKGTGLGAIVKAPASSTTWKRNTTVY